jgi:O-acetyl-ADP-ribose deacetylase (regulator of RNase III)
MIYRKGDATCTDAPYLLHGCNCRGVMGSGIAKAIRDKFPLAYDTYKAKEEKDGLILGEYSIYRKSTPSIVNLHTQKNFGNDGAVYADAIAIRSSVGSFLIDEFSNSTYPGCISIAIPKIGCGLGGLDWKHVERIFQSIEYDWKGRIEFVAYEL